jgi:tetratricopeptide (TPR) repeat protein
LTGKWFLKQAQSHSCLPLGAILMIKGIMNLQKLFLFLVVTHFLCFEISAQINRTESLCKKRVLQKWEILSQEGKYEEAIAELQKQMDLEDNKSKHKNYWHLGQLYAFNGDYATAISHLKKSTNMFDLLFDKFWRYYYKGTIAFLQRDKTKLNKYNSKMQKKKSAYYEGSTNTLKSLYENFDKEYVEAYNK